MATISVDGQGYHSRYGLQYVKKIFNSFQAVIGDVNIRDGETLRQMRNGCRRAERVVGEVDRL